MWSPHVLYRHVNNRDVAFVVQSRHFIREKDMWSLKVRWWNIGACHDPEPMGFTQRLTLASSAHGRDWLQFGLSERVAPPRHVHYHACPKCGQPCEIDEGDKICPHCDAD